MKALNSRMKEATKPLRKTLHDMARKPQPEFRLLCPAGAQDETTFQSHLPFCIW